ncbi:MAG: type II secretion system GspH family protein [Epsilonproteobacteria bacterium]|nr:type II secretion system GspH family protein [Campylobacterota bacterium]
MKNIKSKQAFTMIELVFVIVIIGILAGVAIPRLAATRDDAVITKARTTVASVRNALAMEKQKRILRGEFTQITAVGDGTNVFGNFYDTNGDTNVAVLEYAIASESGKKDRWSFSNDEYIFKSILGDVKFQVITGKFECDPAKTTNTNATGCTQLTN